jgi:hypothetical protein
MITLTLTPEQQTSLLKTNFAAVELDRPVQVYRGDTVQAADRLCHVSAVTDNPFRETVTIYLRMGA